MRTICIPIDKRNECREKGGNGIGNDGDPMYSLTASMGGHFEPAICLWEESDAVDRQTSEHGQRGYLPDDGGEMGDRGRQCALPSADGDG